MFYQIIKSSLSLSLVNDYKLVSYQKSYLTYQYVHTYFFCSIKLVYLSDCVKNFYIENLDIKVNHNKNNNFKNILCVLYKEK